MPGGAPKGNHNRLKYGFSHTRIDNIYKAMISRCYHKTNNRYKNYGAKGISVCDEWLHDKTSFFKWAFANGYDPSLTIDRIDCNGNYEPSNCRWASYVEQANNKTNNRILTVNGTSHTMAEWSRIHGVKIGTIYARLKTGWDVEDAICIPVGKR